MAGSFVRLGNDFWMMPNRIPIHMVAPDRFVANPQASSRGMMSKLTFQGALGDLTPTTSLQEIGAPVSFPAASFASWRFQVSGLAGTDGIMFSTHPDFLISGHVPSFQAVIDITDDSDFGRVIVSNVYPQLMATTSHNPWEWSPYGPPMIPWGTWRQLGTTIWTFNPVDYGLGDGWYRVRVRGATTQTPFFNWYTPEGGTFSLGYQIVPRGLGANIRYLPQTPITLEPVRFELEWWRPGEAPGAYTVDWDFGDGGVASTSNTPLVTHVYTRDTVDSQPYVTARITAGGVVFTAAIGFVALGNDMTAMRVFTKAPDAFTTGLTFRLNGCHADALSQVSGHLTATP